MSIITNTTKAITSNATYDKHPTNRFPFSPFFPEKKKKKKKLPKFQLAIFKNVDFMAYGWF